MKVVRLKSCHVDDRGQITDIITKDVVEHVSLITSRKGAIRGNHYHKETVQTLYILEGKMKLLTQIPDEDVVTTILERGDLAVTYPLERHTLIALEESIFLVFTRGPRGGEDYEKDTYRLKIPLQG
ncbi:hypothetical protein MYX82_00205 [Acidobacteria bacterium AH-259-D05]|nr:hypothetical protein [Acidobacteria bacterium AH-259-D05]